MFFSRTPAVNSVSDLKQTNKRQRQRFAVTAAWCIIYHYTLYTYIYTEWGSWNSAIFLVVISPNKACLTQIFSLYVLRSWMIIKIFFFILIVFCFYFYLFGGKYLFFILMFLYFLTSFFFFQLFIGHWFCRLVGRQMTSRKYRFKQSGS